MTYYDLGEVTCVREPNQRRAWPSQGSTDRNVFCRSKSCHPCSDAWNRKPCKKSVHNDTYGIAICDVNALLHLQATFRKFTIDKEHVTYGIVFGLTRECDSYLWNPHAPFHSWLVGLWIMGYELWVVTLGGCYAVMVGDVPFLIVSA